MQLAPNSDTSLGYADISDPDRNQTLDCKNSEFLVAYHRQSYQTMMIEAVRWDQSRIVCLTRQARNRPLADRPLEEDLCRGCPFPVLDENYTKQGSVALFWGKLIKRLSSVSLFGIHCEARNLVLCVGGVDHPVLMRDCAKIYFSVNVTLITVQNVRYSTKSMLDIYLGLISHPTRNKETTTL